MKVCTSVANVGFSKSRVSSNQSNGSLIAQAVGLEANGPGAYESILTKLAKVLLRFLRTLLACLTIPCLASSEPGSFERKPLRPHIGCFYKTCNDDRCADFYSSWGYVGNDRQKMYWSTAQLPVQCQSQGSRPMGQEHELSVKMKMYVTSRAR